MLVPAANCDRPDFRYCVTYSSAPSSTSLTPNATGSFSGSIGLMETPILTPAADSAAAALMRFDSSPWIGKIDVPTAVVVTELDRLISPASQRAMAQQISGSVVHEVRGDHSVCVTQPGLFVPILEQASAAVVKSVAKNVGRSR